MTPCPICHQTMDVHRKSGIELEYCSQCRGVWLSREHYENLITLASASPSYSPLRNELNHPTPSLGKSSHPTPKPPSWLARLIQLD